MLSTRNNREFDNSKLVNKGHPPGIPENKLMLSKSVNRAYKRFAAVTQDGVKLDFMVHMGSKKKNGAKGSVHLAETRNSGESIKNTKSTKAKTMTANTAADAVLTTTPGTAEEQKTQRSMAVTDRSKKLEKHESMGADVDSILKSERGSRHQTAKFKAAETAGDQDLNVYLENESHAVE